MNRRSSTRRAVVPAFVAAMLAVAGCGGSDEEASPSRTTTIPGAAGNVTCTAPEGATGPGAGTKAVGFVYAGSKTDLGYNQAVHTAAVALREACTDLEISESEAVPDAAGMRQAADRMIRDGARIVFSTSPTYAEAAVELAKEHSDVVVLQQGAVVDEPLPANLATYDGSTYETFYLAGIAAASATRSKKLGFVAASAQPRVLTDVNAFALGAQSVDPQIRTQVTFTGSSCDPAAQRRAARSLLSARADVLAQQQDCTATVIKAAEAKGVHSVGFHFNARALAPKGWLTGIESNWAPLFGAIVSSVQKGAFAKSEYHDNVVVGFSSTKIPPPTRLARYGPAIGVDVAQRISNARAQILGGRSPFRGPVVDRNGKLRIARGKSPTTEQLANTSYLVEGVVGTLPR